MCVFIELLQLKTVVFSISIRNFMKTSMPANISPTKTTNGQNEHLPEKSQSATDLTNGIAEKLKNNRLRIKRPVLLYL